MKEKPNLNYIQKISGGDLEFETQLLEIVKNELPNEVKLYQESFEQKNLKQTAEVVHKIKHKISTLGLVLGYQTAVDFENELKQGDFKLKKEFDEILKSMLKFVNSF